VEVCKKGRNKMKDGWERGGESSKAFIGYLSGIYGERGEKGSRVLLRGICHTRGPVARTVPRTRSHPKVRSS